MDKCQNSISVQILVSGRVQGVGFRRFVQKRALELEIEGWVRNLVDGRVEAQACGSKEKIEQLFAILKKGPTFSRVESITMNSVDKIEIEARAFAIVADGEVK